MDMQNIKQKPEASPIVAQYLLDKATINSSLAFGFLQITIMYNG